MSNLAPVDDLSGLVNDLHEQMVQLGLVVQAPPHWLILEPRLTQWAIAALAPTYHPANIIAALAEMPPERHWHYLRARLPDQALRVLYLKIRELQPSERKVNPCS